MNGIWGGILVARAGVDTATISTARRAARGSQCRSSGIMTVLTALEFGHTLQYVFSRGRGIIQAKRLEVLRRRLRRGPMDEGRKPRATTFNDEDSGYERRTHGEVDHPGAPRHSGRVRIA